MTAAYFTYTGTGATTAAAILKPSRSIDQQRLVLKRWDKEVQENTQAYPPKRCVTLLEWVTVPAFSGEILHGMSFSAVQHLAHADRLVRLGWAKWRVCGMGVWLAAAGLVGTGCHEQSAPRATPASAGSILTRQLQSPVRTLDPAMADDAASLQVVDDLFEGLLSVSADGKLVAGTAVRWAQSEDGKVWTFNLRPNARWSNGAPLTAQDFVYAWRRLVDPQVAAARGYLLAPVVNANEIRAGKLPTSQLGVSAPDASTFVVRLSVPTSYFLELVSNPFTAPLYAPAVLSGGAHWTAPRRLVSNGAFRLRDHSLDGKVVLERNLYYWDAAQVRTAAVSYLPLAVRSVVRAGFVADRLHYLDSVPVSEIPWAKTRDARLIRAAHFGTVLLTFDCTRAPFAGNLDLRRALNLAIDRDVLAARITAGTLAPANSLMPPLPGYVRQLPAWVGVSPAARLQLARQLYSRAGFSRLRPLRLELVYPADRAEQRALLEAVAAMWYNALGADVRVREVASGASTVSSQGDTTSRLVLLAQAGEVAMRDPAALLQLFQRDAGRYRGGCVSDKFEAFLRVAATESDRKDRYKFLQQAEAALNDDAAYVPLALAASQRLLKPSVRGFASNAMNRHLTRHLYVSASSAP